jgi:hypothetical protein
MNTQPLDQTEKVEPIRPLRQHDRVTGHDLRQIWCKDNVAVFVRSFPGKAPHEYEVIICSGCPGRTRSQRRRGSEARGLSVVRQVGRARLVDTSPRFSHCVGRNGAGESWQT